MVAVQEAQAAAGEKIVIARADKPVARLVAVEAAPRPRKLGIKAREPFEIKKDFDDPTEDILWSFEGAQGDKT